MIVRPIVLDFSCNYVHPNARFPLEVNAIYNENAQGRTNLLEAVIYLFTASSHRARYDRELIQFDANHAFVKAEVSARGRDSTLKARLGRGIWRQFYPNGVRLKSAGELSGVLNTVSSCLEDLYLTRGGVATRRWFLDGCICRLWSKYAETLTEYRRLYEHKVCIPRDREEHFSLLNALDELSLRMAQTGALPTHYWVHLVKRLRETTPLTHLGFPGGWEKLGLAYETASTVTDPEDSLRSTLPRPSAYQEGHREAELESRQYLSGLHKDDLIVELSGMSARIFASQGQVRTVVLPLKLAPREVFYQKTGEWPVLLLDDVFSELDVRRQEFVFRRISGERVLITCYEDVWLEGLEKGKVFHIRDEALKP